MTWGLVAVAGATLVSGAMASDVAEEAGELQAEAAQAAAQESGRQFDITQEQLEPFREAGVSALQEQQAMLGLLGPEQQAAAYGRIEESPAQQFLRDRQQRALLRTAAATRMGGGNLLTALQRQGMGFAQQDIENRFGRLGSLTGGGRAAAQNIAQYGQQTAQNVGQFGIQAAQAQASGILGAQQAQAGTIQNLAQIGGYALNRPTTPTTPTGPIGTVGVGA